jgi:hypothetical protein
MHIDPENPNQAVSKNASRAMKQARRNGLITEDNFDQFLASIHQEVTDDLAIKFYPKMPTHREIADAMNAKIAERLASRPPTLSLPSDKAVR